MAESRKIGRKRKIGIFGGSFNPIHNGHLRLCDMMAKQAGLTLTLLVPVNLPPHKEGGALASAEHRLQMVRLAVQNQPDIEVSEIELRRKGKSYTIDTVEELEKQYPDAQLYLIMGADMFLTLDRWKDGDRLAKKCGICTMAREEYSRADLLEKAEALQIPSTRLFISHEEKIDLSSTLIRERIRQGEKITGLVPEVVERYIAEHHLYQ